MKNRKPTEKAKTGPKERERREPTSLKRANNKTKVSVRDWVKISNQKKVQENEERVVKTNRLTGYVTVEAKDSKKKIVRLQKNLCRIQQEE